LAVDTGVDGLDVVIGTSSFLREHSHGKDMAYITKTALEVIEYIKSKGLEVRCKSPRLLGLFTRQELGWVWSQRVQCANILQFRVRIASGRTSWTYCPFTRL
jgi:isopropylmalate/homocitrate/citramalate synthase